MNVITAPELFENTEHPTVFLAGGITDCPWWQDDIIEMLGDTLGTLFNPRRRDFPIGDPNAAHEQIQWEFNAIANTDIFSIWFASGPSDQPICMYELGRNLAKWEGRMLDRTKFIVGCDPEYIRKQDVYIQVGLVSPQMAMRIATSVEEHAANIKTAVEAW